MFRRSTVAICFAVAASALPADAAPAYSIQRSCTFAARVLPGGTDQTVFLSGFATATGPKVPYVTSITCEVENVTAGGTDQASTTTTLLGGASATAAVVGGFDVGIPIRVCSSAWAMYGPDPLVTLTAPKICF